MITAVALERYRLRLRLPWVSARGSEGERSGWLVRCEAGGLAGYGDCAPLPAAGTEDEAAGWAWLCAWRDGCVGHSVGAALADLDRGPSAAPAARYAAECALADLAAQAAGVPLCGWLNPSLRSGAPRSVAVNAALGPLGRLTRMEIEDSAAQGYRVLKVKVGLDGLGAELDRLAELARYLPAGGQFRLDANGGWTLAEARRAVAAANALPVEAIEEPLRHANPANLRELQTQAACSLALDESVARWDAGSDFDVVPVRRLVLKPAVLGGLRRTLDLARMAQAAGIEVVVTSLIESAAGLWPTVHLAAAIGSPIPQGLATAVWLSQDLGEAPCPAMGRIVIPQVPGSGFRPA